MPNSVSGSTPKPIKFDSSSEESSDEEQPIMNRWPENELSDTSDSDTDTSSLDTSSLSSLIDSVYNTDSHSGEEFDEIHEPAANNRVQTPPTVEPPPPPPPIAPLSGTRDGVPGPIRNVARRGRLNRHMPRRYILTEIVIRGRSRR